jgi:hypothetical protein
MRMAVLYSGHLRTWGVCQPNQQDSFYTEDTDAYFYTYDEPQNTKYKQFIQIKGTYYAKNIEEYEINKHYSTISAKNILWAWHNQFIGFCLVPMDYDVYIKSRCDITLSGKIDFNKYEINNKNIYIPGGQDYLPGAINDQFAFGSYDVMKKYFGLYLNHMDLYRAGFVFHPETYVLQNLIRQGIDIIRMDITNDTIR